MVMGTPAREKTYSFIMGATLTAGASLTALTNLIFLSAAFIVVPFTVTPFIEVLFIVVPETVLVLTSLMAVLLVVTAVLDFTCGVVVFLTDGTVCAFTPPTNNNAPSAATIFFIILFFRSQQIYVF